MTSMDGDPASDDQSAPGSAGPGLPPRVEQDAAAGGSGAAGRARVGDPECLFR